MGYNAQGTVHRRNEAAMLNQVDLTCSIGRREYRRRFPDLQARLYDLEQALFETRMPALIVIEGWAGAAKARAISTLTRQLDPRGIRVHPITPPRTYEMQYPWLYRFWLKIPSSGQLAIFDRSWYREIYAARVNGTLPEADWRRYCEDIVDFERQLAQDGALILKFWMHLSCKEQRKRLRQITNDPVRAWQVTEEDQWQNRHYRLVHDVVDDMLTRTDTPHARWSVVPADSPRYARLTMIESTVTALEERLGRVSRPLAEDAQEVLIDAGANQRRIHLLPTPPDGGQALAPIAVPPQLQAPAPAFTPPSILHRVDLSLKLDQKTYDAKLHRLQAKLHLLGFQVYLQKRPVILVFEGWDAAGKGGAIRRITEELDPRGYVVHAIAAPAGEDKTHHYLYRFWRRLPSRGQIAIFDRSWYGRVLVERIEGFATSHEWLRAYAEINQFERQLIDFGTIVCKFWMHISREEQLRRFNERQNIPYKAWKLTEEDWRNREKWPLYEQAVDEMLLRTSTPAAPWTIVEAEDKRFARIKVLRTIVQRLEAELGKVKL
jgi:polyphosphate kinase 2 (PPK2 family)